LVLLNTYIAFQKS